jgi:enamine deaminase RidA (YjgF/YER057c/UK114 family)
MDEMRFLNPDGVFDPSPLYSHVVVPPPGRPVFLAGQWGGDRDGNLVPGGFAAQVEQAYANVMVQLEAVGLGPEHVAKLIHYVVDLDGDKRAEMHARVGAVWTGLRPASTLLGVAALAREGMLYEVDVAAVLPES